MKFEVGAKFPSLKMDVSEETIRQYAAASYDFNPLHLDPKWMAETSFGGTRFGTVIAHGLMTYSLMCRVFTDVVYPLGGWHERCEVRFLSPVKPGYTIEATATILEVREMGDQLLYRAEVEVHNQDGELVAKGDAMGRVPLNAVAS